MIDRGAELSVKRQCELLDLNRTGVYYTPRPVPEEDLTRRRQVTNHLDKALRNGRCRRIKGYIAS